MKNKLLTIVTCMMLASLCTFGLTACGGHEHAYTDVVTPPTCTEQGFTTHTCECGDVKVDTYVNATGHTWVAADCDTKRTCSVCGTTDGEPLGHSFTTYTSNNDATCLADGTKTATCSREGCNETETITDVGSKLSHSYANYVYNNDAKCGVDGTETGTCTTENCGATDTRTKAGTALSHVFTTYTYNNDAKCGVDGTETATCDRDDCDEHDTRTKAGTALSHDYEGATYVSNGDATCLADGTKSAVCNHGCGTKDTVADVGSKVDHKFTNYVSNGDATYLADGTKTAKCDYDCKTEDTVADVGSQLKSTLTIVFGNGTENLVINALAGTAIDAVENPTKTGHTFAGWSAEIPATLAAGENTITANWTINQYTLTIVFGNGDSDLVLTQDYDSDIDAIEDPTRNNYIFTGWSATIPTKMPAESLTITAGWTMDISGDPIASVTGYVSDEDDVLVLDTMTYGPDLFADAMVGDVVLANTDYSWNENKLVFTQEFIDQYLGTYQDVYVITNTSDLVYVEMLFADKVLNDAADVQEAFVYGAQALGDTFGKKEGVYVLGADIDMTGVTINNKAIAAGQSFDYYTDNGDGTYTKAGTTATTADFGFAGIFDGMGHSISNITVSLTNHSLGQPIVKEDGTKTWKNASSFGLFTNVHEGSIIKNVAFINVKDNSTVDKTYGLSGVLGNNFHGTLENVYIDINENTIITRGPFAQYGATSVLKNVVVNFPRAEGYSINSHLESANKGNDTYYDTYAYGSGALGGQNSPISTFATYENVLISSAMPVNFYSNAPAKLANVTSVTYGENETELFYDFGQFTGLTVQQAVSLETSAEDFDITKQKIRVLTGVRRYDDLTAMAADSEYVNKLIATGLFKIQDGKVVWHSKKIETTIADAVEFDATEGVLKATALEGKNILSANVNGNTVEYVDGKFVGVPELNNLNSADQLFKMSVETDDTIFTFTNVTYWASIINDQAELKSALDYNYSSSNKNNFAFLKLGNNIDIDKDTWSAIDYSDIKAVGQFNGIQCSTGFAGVFDGCGYTINFNGTGAGEYGLFGTLSSGAQVGIKRPATVKNVAIVEYSQNWKPVIAHFGATHSYNKGALIENVYVTWLKTAVQAGLIFEPNAGTVIRNVMVNVANNTSYGANLDADSYENMSKGYYGGTLYYNLRRAGTALAATTESFVSLGKGALVKNVGAMATTNYEKWFATTGTAAPYTHTLKNGGWAAATGGVVSNPELYFGYASNLEYGDTTINRGMKAGFATIAANYANGAAIAGYYCAECGEVFSLEAGNCTTCSVALTQSANLWREAISYKWEFTKCSEVNNAGASTTGEMVFANTYKYNDATEMATAYNADNTLFASFVGDAGNGLWAVNEGVLTWVGNTTAA